MNSKLKIFLTIVAKNAVNAVITNAALMALLPTVFEIHNADGWWNILKLTAGVVGGRELAVWGPVVLRWSKTKADPELPNGGSET